MLNLMAGITAYMQANFQDVVGNYISGNTTLYGPFLNVAPENPAGAGPKPPYMTMQVFGQPMDQGFLNSTGSTFYVEKPRVRFMVWDTNSLAAMQSIESVCSALDRLGTLPLDDGESAVSILRTVNAQNIPQPIGRNGERIYMWFADYEWRVARTLGV